MIRCYVDRWVLKVGVKFYAKILKVGLGKHTAYTSLTNPL